jgi:hypothetical protein
MKWLIINIEAFSPKGLKKQKDVGFDDLPWIVRKFLSAFPKVFIVLDESSKIKTSQPMDEAKKSSRTRLIKLLAQTNSDRAIMTGTLMSKSPLNVIDQYAFLREGYIPESAYQFAERYCVMQTLPIGRGRRVLITQKDYAKIRKKLAGAFRRGGEIQLQCAKESVFKQYAIDYVKQEHIIRHRKYSPFINQDDLLRRIAPDTLFVSREDVFDITFEKFVLEPIKRPVELSAVAKKIAHELIDLGFTDNLVLGKAAALELMIRLQDICNGFEPVKDANDRVTLKPLPENPKLEALMELLEEIDVGENQVVIWSSRTALLDAIAGRLAADSVPYVVYNGAKSAQEKLSAENLFQRGVAQVFLANPASGAYGLNCLAQCSYAVYMCVDGSVEKYHQSQHRILRGQLTAPKFSYTVYARGSVEERVWEALRVGQELISANNTRDLFEFR